jgi:hypothetical protein
MRRCAELSRRCPEPLRLRGPLFNDHDRDPEQQPGSILTSRPGSILASVEDKLGILGIEEIPADPAKRASDDQEFS